MRTNLSFAIVLLLLTLAAQAQSAAPRAKPAQPPTAIAGRGNRIFVRGEMGKWWKDSEIAKKLQLSETQAAQLDQTFYDHKLKLIDYGAEMEKEDLKLQNLLDADVPNEGQITTQVDQVLSARGKLEREYTMMNLDLRRSLSLEQWRQLKTIREERGPADRVIYFKGKGPHGGPAMLEMGPPPPDAKTFSSPVPPPPPDDME